MNKRKIKQEVEEKLNVSAQFLNSKTGQLFIAWWKDHRHSGYSTKGVETRWTIPPMIACNCDRYMAEFCSDNNLQERLRFEYSAEEYERWAKEKRIAEKHVEKFAVSHDGREIPTVDEFEKAMRLCSMFLGRQFATEESPSKNLKVEDYARETGQEWLLEILKNPIQ